MVLRVFAGLSHHKWTQEPQAASEPGWNQHFLLLPENNLQFAMSPLQADRSLGQRSSSKAGPFGAAPELAVQASGVVCLDQQANSAESVSPL